MKSIVTAVLLLCLLPAFVSAKDWPGWRGADRNDHSPDKGLLKEWPADGPERIWLFDEAGLGYAGFSIVDKTLYTMGAFDGETRLLALDARTGARKWALKMTDFFAEMSKWGDGPRGTPTVSDGHVYALAGNGTLVCASTDGNEVWRKSLVDDLGGGVPKWGYSESPLVEGDMLIVTPGGADGTLAALDKKTGKTIWRSTDFTDGAAYSSVIAVDHGGKRMLVQLVEKNFVGIDAKDGSVMWKHEWPGRVAVIPTPIYHEGKVFVATGYGVGCKQVELVDGTAKETWMNKNMKNHHGGVILLDDHLYGYSDGIGWACLSWDSGEIVWSEKKALGKGTVTYADGNFYCVDEKTGDVVLLRATTEGYNEASRFTLSPQTKQRKPDGRIWTHPVVLDGKLYLRDQEYIHCYDVTAK